MREEPESGEFSDGLQLLRRLGGSDVTDVAL